VSFRQCCGSAFVSIRIWNSFYLNAGPDPGNKTNEEDPDPGQTLKSQKVEFLHGKYVRY
jgi:hypothetical protein